MYGSIPSVEEPPGAQRRRRWNFFFVGVLLFVIAAVAFGMFFDKSRHGESAAKEAPSRYTSVQTLAFDIGTGPAPVILANNETNPECESLHTHHGTMKEGSKDPRDEACYVGFADLKVDVDRRIALMTEAVDAAYELSDKSETTLKIFLVPEFYFRGPHGAYELGGLLNDETPGKDELELSAVVRIGIALEKLVEQAKYKDWFFVFGTVVGVDRSFDPNDPEEERRFINFSFMLKGFDPATTSPSGMRFVAPKTYVSKIDFLSPTRGRGSTITTDPDDQGHHTFDNDVILDLVWDRLHERDFEVITHNWFSLDGILFSIEICLDHKLGRAVRSFLNYNLKGMDIPQGGEGGLSRTRMHNLAQISLVISAGMTINEHNLVLREGGLVFIEDGDDGEDVVWRRQTGTDDFFSEYQHTVANASYPWGTQRPYFLGDTSGVFSEAGPTPRLLDYGTIALR